MKAQPQFLPYVQRDGKDFFPKTQIELKIHGYEIRTCEWFVSIRFYVYEEICRYLSQAYIFRRYISHKACMPETCIL